MKKNLLLLLLISGFAQAQIINIPDVNLKNKLLEGGVAYTMTNIMIDLDPDLDGNIQASDAALVEKLYVSNSLIVDITGLEAFVNIKLLDINDNNIVSLAPVNGLQQLQGLYADRNVLSNVVLQNLPSLLELSAIETDMVSFSAANLPNAQTLAILWSPLLEEVSVDNMPSLLGLAAEEAPLLRSISMTNCPLATLVGFTSTIVREIDLSNCPSLTGNDMFSNLHQLETLNLLNCSGLQYLVILDAPLNEHNALTSLNITGCTGLVEMMLGTGMLTSIDLTNKPNLTLGYFPFNELNTILLDDSTANLGMLDLRGNNLTALDLSHTPALVTLYLNDNPITSLDLSLVPALVELHCPNTPLTTLDASQLPMLNWLDCSNTAISTLNIKNGHIENTLIISEMFLLAHICADTDQVDSIAGNMDPTVVVNDYCNFVPGGDYNIITGSVRFDSNNNGCDASDINFPNYVRLDADNGATTSTTFVNTSGTYNFYTGAGSYTVTPSIAESTYFSLSPASAIADFPVLDNSVQTLDFCLTALGDHTDLSVMLTGQPPRPGFNRNYRLVYRNNGNTVQSGSVTLTFDARLGFVTAVPAIAGQSGNTLTWNFNNLPPFASQGIDIAMHANAPTDVPPLIEGDIVSFTATVEISENEETPADNTFTWQTTAINSYDPNNKICLEGETATAQLIGEYLHYNINFENVGSADAINVVVKDVIDASRFDVSSLQILHASHPMYARLADNKIEFIFENINLPPSALDPIGGHGNVLFKIRTLPTLNVGDIVTNTAHIYFDYNHPIETNEARTTFETLKRQEFNTDESVVVYPNPTNGKITIGAQNNLISITVFDLQGRVLQVTPAKNLQSQVDLTNQTDGIYFLKITTEKGNKIEKIIKR